MFKKKQTLTALDIGTSKISVLIGDCDSEGRITALSLAERDSDESVCKGEIRNMDEVSKKLFDALEEASSSAGREIVPDNIFFSVTGAHIHSQQSVGSVTIMNQDRKVSPEDVMEARRIAQQNSLPLNNCSINTVESNFLLDNSRKVENPLGQSASRLDAYSFCVFGDTSAINNYKRPIDDCGYFNPRQLPVFSGIASAMAALSQDDLKYGSLLIDVGAGTSEYVLFHGSGYFNCGVIPVGCDHIANDLSIGLDLPIPRARKLLIENFSSDDFLLEPLIKIEGTIDRKVPSASVEKIAEMRMNEIFENIATSLKSSNLKTHLGRGVIICGGGAKIAPLLKCAEKVFDTPVRIGLAREIDGAVSKMSDPRYTCVAGLLKYGAMFRLGRADSMGIISGVDRGLRAILLDIWRKISESIKF